MSAAQSSRYDFSSWGVGVRLEWNCPSLKRPLRGLRLPTWQPLGPDQPRATFRLLRDAAGELSIEGPPDEPSRSSRANTLAALERRLHLYLASHTRQVAYFHAAVVHWQGRALVLPGSSYAGKSTLVGQLVSRGGRLLSDEYAIVDPQGWIHAFPRPVSLRSPEGEIRIPAKAWGYSQDLSPSRAGVVLFCRYQAGEVFAPSPLSPGQAALELLQHSVSARKSPELVGLCVEKLVLSARCWRSWRGEAELAASQILSLADV